MLSFAATDTWSMVWFFERSADTFELETRYDNETLEYVLECRVPGLPRKIERFPTAKAFRTRIAEIENGLSADCWRLKGDPAILPDGWPKRARYSGEVINANTISAATKSPPNEFSLPNQNAYPPSSGSRFM